jgi:hypothetical protein
MEQMVSVGGYSVLPAEYAAAYVRQLAVHANLAVLAHRKQNSTWLDRLKQVETIRRRFAPADKSAKVGGGAAAEAQGSSEGAGMLLPQGSAAAVEAAALPAAAFDFTRFM